MTKRHSSRFAEGSDAPAAATPSLLQDILAQNWSAALAELPEGLRNAVTLLNQVIQEAGVTPAMAMQPAFRRLAKQETADILGISLDALNARLRRAFPIVRKHLLGM